jgi:tRNA(Arg) A34 adenosine deaminase TadA
LAPKVSFQVKYAIKYILFDDLNYDIGSIPDNFYLCTGLDLYLSKEPDIFSSMALVHSRIGRIFYKIADPVDGAIESNFHIHCLRTLNHHYRAFHMKN